MEKGFVYTFMPKDTNPDPAAATLQRLLTEWGYEIRRPAAPSCDGYDMLQLQVGVDSPICPEHLGRLEREGFRQVEEDGRHDPLLNPDYAAGFVE